MTARDQQQEIGEADAVTEARCQRVSLEVVDGRELESVGERDRLGGDDAHHQPADQPRPGGGGYPVEIGEADASLGQRARDQAVQVLEVGPGGDLGHDAAIGAVLVQLRQHQVGPYPPIVVDDGGGGLVATGLDAENDHQHSLCRMRPGLYSLGPAGTTRRSPSMGV